MCHFQRLLISRLLLTLLKLKPDYYSHNQLPLDSIADYVDALMSPIQVEEAIQ